VTQSEAAAALRSIDRVRTALELRAPPDHVPAGWWMHAYREEWSPEDLAAVTVGRQRRFGWDFVKLQPRATCFAESFGSEYRPSGDAGEAPVLVQAAVRGPDDWSRLPAVDATVPPLAEQTRALALVTEGVGRDVPVVQTVFSPLTVAGYMVGEDRLRVAEEIRERPEALRPVLERIADALVDFARASVEAGAAGIFFAVSGYASADVMTAGDYLRLALPHDIRVLESLPDRAWFNVVHLCGPRIHVRVAGELPARAVSWSVHEPGNPSLAEGRDRWGRAAMGGIDHAGTLVRGSRDDVVREVRGALGATGGRGVLVAPGCSVPPVAPQGNLTAMMETARSSPP
jgi:uroporphyrinogen decarboxylase